MKTDLQDLVMEQINAKLVFYNAMLITRVLDSSVLIERKYLIRRDKHYNSKGWYQKHNKSKKRHQR